MMAKIVIRNISIFFLFSSIISCDPIPNSSIIEPLSVNELSSIINKDSTFKNTYEFLESTKIFLNTDVERVDFLNLTYREFHKFFQVANRDGYNKIDSFYYSEWQRELNSYEKKIDSVSNFWKNKLEAEKITQFLDVEFLGITKYTKYGLVDSYGLKFKLDPKTRLDKIRILFRLDDLGSDFIHEKFLGVEDVFYDYEVFELKDVDKADVYENRISRNSRKLFSQLYSDDKYLEKELVYSIGEIIIDNQRVRNVVKEIPISIRNLWILEIKGSPLYRKEMIKKMIVEEHFNEDFEDMTEYVYSRVKKDLYKISPLSAKYYYKVVNDLSKF
jgi:hypothetical protein